MNNNNNIPTSIQECYDRSICTYAFTGKEYAEQIWYRTPEFPATEGFCLVCANAHFGDRTSEWIGSRGKFFCDFGAMGLSSKLPSFYKGSSEDSSFQSSFPSQNSTFQNSTTFQDNEKETIVNPNLRLDLERGKQTEVSQILKGLTNEGRAEVLTEDLTDARNRNDGTIVFHSNYINYLYSCWSSHAGLVIRPSDIWFLIANQLAKHINDPINAETYRRHFSSALPGAAKEKLLFVVANPNLLNIDMIIDRLKEKVKIDISLFCPIFTDSTKKSQEAIGACFCEAMEAYYEYDTSRCGISKVRVCGLEEDWKRISDNAIALSSILTNAKTYLVEVAQLVSEIWFNRSDPKTWENFFKIRSCGSGHDTVVVGSITKLYALTVKLQDFSRYGKSYYDNPNYGGTSNSNKMDEDPRCKLGANLCEFKDGSQVTYTNIDSNTQFKKTYGIMSSVLASDGFQTPNFNYVLLRMLSSDERVLNLFDKQESSKTHESLTYRCP